MTSQIPTKDETNLNHSGPPPTPTPARRTWPERIGAWGWPRRHVTLMIVLFAAWVAAARLLDTGKHFNHGLMIALILGLIGLLLLIVVLRWRFTEPLPRIAAAVVGPVAAWLIGLLVIAALFQFRDWTQYVVAGGLLIAGLGGLLLFLPCWWIVLDPGDIYYVRRMVAPAHQFHLVTYGGPRVTGAVLDRLVALGIARADLDRFLEYGGVEVGLRRLRMTFTHDPRTRAELPPEQQNRDGLAWLDELERQVNDPANQRETVIWFAPLDHVWLLWNRRETVDIRRDITGLVTRGPGALEIELQFSCEFNPMTVTAVEFYLGLSNRRSVQAVKDVVRAIMSRGAERAAITFFVERTFEDALTEASITAFRDYLFNSLAWAAVFLGISIEPFSFQCRPLVPYPVAQAQQRRLASQAQTDAEYYKIDALIQQAKANNISVEMVGRLQYLIQEMDGLRRPPQDLFTQLPASAPAPRAIGSGSAAGGGSIPASGSAGGASASAGSGSTASAQANPSDGSIDYDAIPLFRDKDGVYRPRE